MILGNCRIFFLNSFFRAVFCNYIILIAFFICVINGQRLPRSSSRSGIRLINVSVGCRNGCPLFNFLIAHFSFQGQIRAQRVGRGDRFSVRRNFLRGNNRAVRAGVGAQPKVNRQGIGILRGRLVAAKRTGILRLYGIDIRRNFARVCGARRHRNILKGLFSREGSHPAQTARVNRNRNFRGHRRAEALFNSLDSPFIENRGVRLIPHHLHCDRHAAQLAHGIAIQRCRSDIADPVDDSVDIAPINGSAGAGIICPICNGIVFL